MYAGVRNANLLASRQWGHVEIVKGSVEEHTGPV